MDHVLWSISASWSITFGMAATAAHLDGLPAPAPTLTAVHRATLSLLLSLGFAALAFEVLQRPLGLRSADRSLGLLVLVAAASMAVALRAAWLPVRRRAWGLAAVALVVWMPAQGMHVRAPSADP